MRAEPAAEPARDEIAIVESKTEPVAKKAPPIAPAAPIKTGLTA